MKKHKLVSILFVISTVCLWFCILWLSFIVGYDVFADAKINDNFKVTPNHVTGYSVPVHIQLNKHDNIVNYVGPNQSGSITMEDLKADGHELLRQNLFYNRKNYSYTLINSQLQLSSFNIIQVSEAETARLENITGNLIISPDNELLRLLLATRNYGLAIVTILILWYLRKFFKSLNQKFEFNESAQRKIRLIALLLLGYQLLTFIITTMISYMGNSISNTITVGNVSLISYSAHARQELNITLILVALSLLVISKLLSYGYELQQESNLTI
ncbi:MAG: DUF2975 domain-containing protein [Flavobacterium sp.]